jgi:primosomal protein N' (replication factor Y)
MALIRAEAQQESDAVALLQAMADLLHGVTEVAVIGPMPAPLVRRAGRYRYQLLLHSQQRKYLHTWLQQCRPALEALPQGRKARWSLDIDPQDFT